MSNNSFKALFAAFGVGLVLSFILPFYTSSTAVIYLITDIVESFVYAIVFLPYDRAHFYRSSLFHYVFATTLVAFSLISLLFLVIGW